MRVKDLLDKVYVTVDLIDLTTGDVIISFTPEYKHRVKKYYDNEIYAIMACKNKLQIIIGGQENEN